MTSKREFQSNGRNEEPVLSASTAVKSLFDSKAVSWSEKYDTKLKTRFMVFQAALEKCHGQEGRRLLDVGCGSGVMTGLAVRLGFKVTAIDVSPKMVEVCKKLLSGLSPAPTILTGDIVSMATEFPPFDTIVCSSVFEYLPQPEKMIDVFAGLLVPGGFLCITIPNKVSIIRLLELMAYPFSFLRNLVPLPVRLRNYLLYLSISKARLLPYTFEKFCRKAGFEVLEKYYFGESGNPRIANNFFKAMVFYLLRKT
jgi:SAM-dependent methyltransferase